MHEYKRFQLYSNIFPLIYHLIVLEIKTQYFNQIKRKTVTIIKKKTDTIVGINKFCFLGFNHREASPMIFYLIVLGIIVTKIE